MNTKLVLNKKRDVKRVLAPMAAKGMRWLAAGTLCLTAACFVACGDDDDEDGLGDLYVGESAAVSMPQVSNAGIQFPVTGVYESYYDFEVGNEVLGLEYAFLYANGCMTKVAGRYDYYDFTFSENPLVINTGGEWSERIDNIKVNNAGFIVSCDIHNSSDLSEESTYKFSYDKEGYLVKMECSFKDADDYMDTGSTVYTWENGNLVKMAGTYTGDFENFSWEYEYTYDTSKNPNTGIWCFGDMTEDYILDMRAAEVLCYAGLLGRTTKNIPESEKYTYTSDGEREVYLTIWADVVYNPDGSIASYSTVCDGDVISHSFAYDNVWDSIRRTSAKSVKGIDNAGMSHKSRLGHRNGFGKRRAN